MNRHHLRQAIERRQLEQHEERILSTPGHVLAPPRGKRDATGPTQPLPGKSQRTLDASALWTSEQKQARVDAKAALSRGDMQAAREAIARLCPSFRAQVKASAESNGWGRPS